MVRTIDVTFKYKNAISAFNADVQIQLAKPIAFKIDEVSFRDDAKLLDELEFGIRHGNLRIVKLEDEDGD